MLSTLAKAKESSIGDIAGACINSAPFLRFLNDATRRLMRRGDWTGTVVPIQVCTYGGCVAFPQYVGEVRKINICCNRIPIKNEWYSFLPYDLWPGCCGDSCTIKAWGRSPVLQNVQGEGRLIRVYVRKNIDIDENRTLTIFGTDNHGQTLQHQNTDGTWDEGIIIPFGKPFVSTNIYVRHIERVLKDETDGVIDVYAYNAEDDVLEDIAHYDPNETNPSYAQYKVNACTGNGCLQSIVALVKLQFVPVRKNTDLVLIQNLDALALMMQSLKYEQAGDRNAARTYEADAIRELNLDLWNRDQESAVPISSGDLGTSGIGIQRCF